MDCNTKMDQANKNREGSKKWDTKSLKIKANRVFIDA